VVYKNDTTNMLNGVGTVGGCCSKPKLSLTYTTTAFFGNDVDVDVDVDADADADADADEDVVDADEDVVDADVVDAAAGASFDGTAAGTAGVDADAVAAGATAGTGTEAEAEAGWGIEPSKPGCVFPSHVLHMFSFSSAV
jgi:hypothetical protein